MQHLILTKLAVGNPSEYWLAWRLYLFQYFCAPSVAAQTNKDFRWILAVSPTTPRWFLEGALRVAANAALVYDISPTLAPRWVPLIRPFLIDRPTITTRLDSDDMLHRQFVEVVQATARSCVSDEVIDFPVGLQLRLPGLCLQVSCRKTPDALHLAFRKGRRQEDSVFLLPQPSGQVLSGPNRLNCPIVGRNMPQRQPGQLPQR